MNFNFFQSTCVTEINSLAIIVKSSSSVLDECTYNINRLFNLDWIIAFHKNVFNDENDVSAVAVVMGMYFLKHFFTLIHTFGYISYIGYRLNRSKLQCILYHVCNH